MRALFRVRILWLATAIPCLLGPALCRSAELSDADRKEVRRVVKGLEDGSIPAPPYWTLTHGASETGRKEVEPILGREGPEAAVLKAGGWEKYKANVASLLKSEDAVVRGYAAFWLADLGDRTYVKNLFALLESDSTPTTKNVFPDYDRGKAATALGILGARDHAKDLAKYLKHESAEIRGGAAMGLGYMHAKDYQSDIAVLLDDKEFRVIEAAVSALAEMGAKKYANRFADIALRDVPLAAEAALDALVVLGAMEQASQIARLLKDKDSFRRPDVIMVLALLDCREYLRDLAALIDAEESSTRRTAICALGIMKASDYAPKIARYLKSEDRSDRQAAAWSLIMMESKEHAAKSVSIYSAFDAQQSGIPPRICPSKERQIRKRFDESLARMKAASK